MLFFLIWQSVAARYNTFTLFISPVSNIFCFQLGFWRDWVSEGSGEEAVPTLPVHHPRKENIQRAAAAQPHEARERKSPGIHPASLPCLHHLNLWQTSSSSARDIHCSVVQLWEEDCTHFSVAVCRRSGPCTQHLTSRFQYSWYGKHWKVFISALWNVWWEPCDIKRCTINQRNRKHVTCACVFVLTGYGFIAFLLNLSLYMSCTFLHKWPAIAMHTVGFTQVRNTCKRCQKHGVN